MSTLRLVYEPQYDASSYGGALEKSVSSLNEILYLPGRRSIFNTIFKILHIENFIDDCFQATNDTSYPPTSFNVYLQEKVLQLKSNLRLEYENLNEIMLLYWAKPRSTQELCEILQLRYAASTFPTSSRAMISLLNLEQYLWLTRHFSSRVNNSYTNRGIIANFAESH